MRRCEGLISSSASCGRAAGGGGWPLSCVCVPRRAELSHVEPIRRPNSSVARLGPSLSLSRSLSLSPPHPSRVPPPSLAQNPFADPAVQAGLQSRTHDDYQPSSKSPSPYPLDDVAPPAPGQDVQARLEDLQRRERELAVRFHPLTGTPHSSTEPSRPPPLLQARESALTQKQEHIRKQCGPLSLHSTCAHALTPHLGRLPRPPAVDATTGRTTSSRSCSTASTRRSRHSTRPWSSPCTASGCSLSSSSPSTSSAASS